jgi:hypothetical protein
MTLDDIKNKWKQLCSDMNSKGIPIPTLRDPIRKVGSLSCTLLVISATIVILGLLGRTAALLNGINVDQALQFFVYCAGLYFGRTIVTKDGARLGQDAKDKDQDVGK